MKCVHGRSLSLNINTPDHSRSEHVVGELESLILYLLIVALRPPFLRFLPIGLSPAHDRYKVSSLTHIWPHSVTFSHICSTSKRILRQYRGMS